MSVDPYSLWDGKEEKIRGHFKCRAELIWILHSNFRGKHTYCFKPETGSLKQILKHNLLITIKKDNIMWKQRENKLHKGNTSHNQDTRIWKHIVSVFIKKSPLKPSWQSLQWMVIFQYHSSLQVQLINPQYFELRSIYTSYFQRFCH